MRKINIKSLVIGFILSSLLFNSVSVFANVQEYILNKVNYKIIVNGKEYKDNSLPVLNYNGTTYVPLKNIGTMLNTKVNWNGDLQQVEIGDNTISVNHPTNSKSFYSQDVLTILDRKHPNSQIKISEDLTWIEMFGKKYSTPTSVLNGKLMINIESLLDDNLISLDDLN